MPGAIGWAPALLPSRGGVIAHPKVQSRNSDSARCDWEIEEVAEAALLPVASTLRSGKLDRPVKYKRFRRSNILAIRAPEPPVKPGSFSADLGRAVFILGRTVR